MIKRCWMQQSWALSEKIILYYPAGFDDDDDDDGDVAENNVDVDCKETMKRMRLSHKIHCYSD